MTRYRCLSHESLRVVLATLPIRNKSYKRRAEESGLFVPKRQRIIQATEDKIKELNKDFQRQYSVSFEKALQVHNKQKGKEERTKIAKKMKEDIENQYNESSVQRYILYAKT